MLFVFRRSFSAFVKGLNLVVLICIGAGPKEASRATGVVWGTKGSVVGRLFQSWALEVTFFSWQRSNRRLSHQIAWVMASLKEEGLRVSTKDLEHHHEAHSETDQSRQLLPN
jgi:hypothetical protein